MTFKSLLCIGFVALLAFAGGTARATAVAQPNEIFTFTGACSDCSGSGIGELTLLPSYALGQTISAANFVSFTYVSNLVPSFVITASPTVTLSGALTIVPGVDTVLISAPTNGSVLDYFSSAAPDGSWCLGISCFSASDYGRTHVWTAGVPSAAPEPSSWALMIVGAGMVGAALRSRASTTVGMA